MDKHNKRHKIQPKATGKSPDGKAVPVAVVEPVVTKVNGTPGVKGTAQKK